MGPLGQVALAGEALWRTLAQMRSGRLWIPWLALFGAQLAALLVLIGFAHPALSWCMTPLVGALAGGAALHYPGFFRALPALHARADVVLAVLPGALVVGWATGLFAARWRGEVPGPRTAWDLTVRRAGALILASLPAPLLGALVTAALERATAGESGLARRIAWLTSLGGVVVVRACFLYVPPLVVLGGRGLRGALAALPRAWGSGFWAALALEAALAAPLLAFGRSGWSGDWLVERGRPELVTWLMIAQNAVGLARSFLLAGAATLVYLGAVADPPGKGR